MNKTDEINAAFVVALSDEEFDEYADDLTDHEREYIVKQLTDYRSLLVTRLNEILKGVK